MLPFQKLSHGNSTVFQVACGLVQDKNAAAFELALNSLPKPILAYCRTGVRSSTLSSLAQSKGMPLADILNTTRQAGFNMSGVVRGMANGGTTPVDQIDASYDVAIVGAGALGIAVAASLKKRKLDLEIAVIDLADTHYDQPGWTMVAHTASQCAPDFTAVGLAIAAMYLTPLIYFLPKATLAATIIVAVLSLVDFKTLKQSWIYSKRDFWAVIVTMLLTQTMGVKIGVTAGVVLSILVFRYDTSRPHVAEVGLVVGTEHFRNIMRYKVETDPAVLSLRIDQSLYFANARFLEDYIYDRVIDDTSLRHVVLMCSAINDIDLSALDTLEMVNTRLNDMGIALSLSEVKGPVMDRLKRGDLLNHLTGDV